MTVAEEIEKLNRLREIGALSEDEFTKAKAELLATKGPAAAAEPERESRSPAAASPDATWSVFLHLSLLAGYIVPLAGFVAPVVIWKLKAKDDSVLDAHGRNVVDWLLSVLIYGFISGFLILVGVGILLLWALAGMNVVFAIVGAVKAASGETWRYPFSIRFFG